MKCTHIERMLPLFVGGDLTPQQADSVRAHLFACQQCSESAAKYEVSQSWLHSSGRPEFDDRFFDDLRSSVWSSIRAENRSGFRVSSWIWAAIPACAIAVLVGGWLFLSQRESTTKPVVTVAKATPTPASPGGVVMSEKPSPHATLKKRRTASSQFFIASSGQRPRVRRSTKSPVRPQVNPLLPLIDVPEPAEVVGSAATLQIRPEAERRMMKIEMQTADPSIRIIWLIPGEEPPGQGPQGPLGFDIE